MASSSICLDATLAAEAATDPGQHRQHGAVGGGCPRAIKNMEKQEREDTDTCNLRRSPAHHWAQTDLNQQEISSVSSVTLCFFTLKGTFSSAS